jgi:hypothetical protein
MDRSDDVTLWNDSEKFRNSSSDCKENGILECVQNTTDNDGSGRERHLMVKPDGIRCVLCIKI